MVYIALRYIVYVDLTVSATEKTLIRKKNWYFTTRFKYRDKLLTWWYKTLWHGSKFMDNLAALRINQEWCLANVLLYASWAACVVLSAGWSLSSLDMNRMMNSETNATSLPIIII